MQGSVRNGLWTGVNNDVGCYTNGMNEWIESEDQSYRLGHEASSEISAFTYIREERNEIPQAAQSSPSAIQLASTKH